MASIWGGDSPSVAWGQNSWQSNTVTISLTGQSLTSSLGSLNAFPEQGWGSDTYGVENWGESGLAVTPTGVSATASVGEIQAFSQTGWGRDEWGEEYWGESFDPVVTLSGQSATTSLGTPTISAQIAAGWGDNDWGVENWGESGLTLELTAPDGLTASLPDVSWGYQTWGSEATGWGGEYYLTPADVMGLTGVSFTSRIGLVTTIPIYGDVDTGSNSSYSTTSTGSNNSYSSVATGSNTSYSDVA